MCQQRTFITPARRASPSLSDKFLPRRAGTLIINGPGVSPGVSVNYRRRWRWSANAPLMKASQISPSALVHYPGHRGLSVRNTPQSVTKSGETMTRRIETRVRPGLRANSRRREQQLISPFLFFFFFFFPFRHGSEGPGEAGATAAHLSGPELHQ